MLSRLKFEIRPLIEEMLDQLPEAVWISETTTFLDPAIGGGQFVAAIEARLRKYGHSDENISGRVYGCEEHLRSVKYAIRKHGLVGTYYACDFLQEEWDMKFDVVVDNPPYQSNGGESGGRHALWRKIVKKSFTLADRNGYVCMVCPGFPISSGDLGQELSNNTPLILNNDVRDYFPGIGSDIKNWIVQIGHHNKNFIVDGNIWEIDADPTIDPRQSVIMQKLLQYEAFTCEYDGGYNSTQFKNNPNDYFEQPQGKSIYPIRHASKVKVCYVSKPTKSHYDRKVMMTLSGYPGFGYYDENNPMSSCLQMSAYIKVKNKKEGDALIDLYSTKKLYLYMQKVLSGKGMNGTGTYSLPKVDLNYTWTDEELYDHFGLTQEERDYIEANVK